MFSTTFELAILVALVTVAVSSPVQVRIETTNQNDFNIGSGPRETFELTEEYRPLSVAFNPRMRGHNVQKQKSSAFPQNSQSVPSPVVEPTNVHYINVNGTEVRIVDTPINKPTNPIDCKKHGTHFVIVKSQPGASSSVSSKWSDWSRWGICQDGNRIRTRQCVVVNNIPCDGPETQTQKCFNYTQSDIPFAKDPLVIEKEILGGDINEVVA